MVAHGDRKLDRPSFLFLLANVRKGELDVSIPKGMASNLTLPNTLPALKRAAFFRVAGSLRSPYV